MKIGDYVRIHTLSGQGGIAKLEKIDDICITDKGAVDKNNIIHSSPNIIDLIEEGDYVNGYRVSYSGGFYQYWDDMFDENTIETDKDIKSIVTKEMFEKMEYKID